MVVMNNIKRIVLLFSALIFLGAIVASYIFFDRTKIHRITFQTKIPPSIPRTSPKQILILNTKCGSGGGEIYTLNLYKHLMKAGHKPLAFIKKESWLESKFREEQLPFYMCKTFKFSFASNLKKICAREDIDIIHCNVEHEVLPSMQSAHDTKTRVVFTRHLPKTQLTLNPKTLKAKGN